MIRERASMLRYTYTVLFFFVINWSVTTAWRVLRLRLEKRMVAAYILNKQSRTAGKEWSSSLGFGEVLTTPYHKNLTILRIIHRGLGTGLIKI